MNETTELKLQRALNSKGAIKNAIEAKGVTVGDGSFAAVERDKDLQVYALPRYDTSTWFILED